MVAPVMTDPVPCSVASLGKVGCSEDAVDPVTSSQAFVIVLLKIQKHH